MPTLSSPLEVRFSPTNGATKRHPIAILHAASVKICGLNSLYTPLMKSLVRKTCLGSWLCLLGVLMLLTTSLGRAETTTATITKKDGTLVTGMVRGFLVLKDKGVKESKKDGSETEFIASYVLLNGDWISAIDSSGVHRGNTFALLTASQKGKLPDDNEVVQAAVTRLKQGSSGPLMAASLPGGGSVFIVGGRSAGPGISKGTLLGQFRDELGKSRVFPSIEVVTEKGVTKVPIAQIADFKD